MTCFSNITTVKIFLEKRLSRTSMLMTINLIVVFMIGSLVVAPFYPGQMYTLIIFSVASFWALAPSVLFQPSFYLLFSSVFLFLGFWAKFIVHFLLGSSFIEPVGKFDNSPAAWDQALMVASAGLSGVAAATLV